MTELKSERLILNFTANERNRLDELCTQHEITAQAEFIRNAVEHYIAYRSRTLKGVELVLRNDAKCEQIHLPVLKEWWQGRNKPEIRRPYEVKVETLFKDSLVKLVKSGVAPSITQLVWTAIGTYAYVLEHRGKGFVLMESYEGSFSDFVLRPLPENPEKPNVLPIEEVLGSWEGKLPRRKRRWWLICPEPLFLQEEGETHFIMARNMFHLNEYRVVARDEKHYAAIAEAIGRYLAPLLPWKRFSERDQEVLRARLESDQFAMSKDNPLVAPTAPNSSPVWLLFMVIPLWTIQEAVSKMEYYLPFWVLEQGIDKGASPFIEETDNCEYSGYLLDTNADNRPAGGSPFSSGVSCKAISFYQRLDYESFIAPRIKVKRAFADVR